MPTRTLIVKLQPHGKAEMPVTLFFQVGDWAVTQGLCTKHSDTCFRVTHVPSTYCIPVCLQSQPVACQIAYRFNRELPKFKTTPRAAMVEQYGKIVREELEETGLALVRM